MLPLPCSISDILGGLLGDIQGIIDGVLGTINNMINTVSNFIGNIGNMINNILSMPSRLLAGIQAGLDNLFKKAKDIIIQQINCVSNLVSSFIGAPAALAQGIEMNVDSLWSSVTGIGDKVADLAYGANAIGKTLLEQADNMQVALNKVFEGTIVSVASAFDSTIGANVKSITGIVNSGIGTIAKIGIAKAVIGAIV